MAFTTFDIQGLNINSGTHVFIKFNDWRLCLVLNLIEKMRSWKKIEYNCRNKINISITNIRYVKLPHFYFILTTSKKYRNFAIYMQLHIWFRNKIVQIVMRLAIIKNSKNAFLNFVSHIHAYIFIHFYVSIQIFLF